jgi:hypothetical protein
MLSILIDGQWALSIVASLVSGAVLVTVFLARIDSKLSNVFRDHEERLDDHEARIIRLENHKRK